MKLRVLHDEIDARVQAIVSGQTDWPCRRGCDDCCRNLAEPPHLTADEWLLLAEAIAALPDERRGSIAQAFTERSEGRALRGCPLLEAGACAVYAARPIACRTYGFYAARDGGRWCERIESRERDEVVFGNHDAIELRLRSASGAGRSVLEWYRERFGV